MMKKPKPMLARKDWRVGVATTFVPGVESFEMLKRTLSALVAINYPHDTWVLDEGDDDRVKSLCDRVGAYHFSRKNLSQYQTENGTYKARTKYGNYNVWLSEIGFRKYDIITGFDPDHVPDPSFLDNALGYFNDPSVGYVQAPQAYYNQNASFIARGAAEETYDYYSCFQMAIYSMDYPVVVGCHNTHRVSALKHVGGFAPHDADDLLITLLYRSSGWKGVYLPKILAKGLTPVDWSGYLTQQFRWAQSVLDIKFRVFSKMAGSLSVKTRFIGLLHGLHYVQNGFFGFLMVCLLEYLLITGVTPEFLSYLTLKKLLILMAVLQLSGLYKQRFFLDWERERGLHWRASLLQVAKWPYIFMGFINTLINRKRPYALTRKVKTESKRYMLLGPHLMIVATLAVAWITGLVFGHAMHPLVLALTVVIGLLSICLMWTETFDFPEPYEERLWIKEFENNKTEQF
jgi:cellulose synthase (UDP-forming)